MRLPKAGSSAFLWHRPTSCLTLWSFLRDSGSRNFFNLDKTKGRQRILVLFQPLYRVFREHSRLCFRFRYFAPTSECNSMFIDLELTRLPQRFCDSIRCWHFDVLTDFFFSTAANRTTRFDKLSSWLARVSSVVSIFFYETFAVYW